MIKFPLHCALLPCDPPISLLRLVLLVLESVSVVGSDSKDQISDRERQNEPKKNSSTIPVLTDSKRAIPPPA